MELVSILVPLYNKDNYVKKSVESLLEQSYNNLDILVCDDASSDNSLEQLSKIKDSRIRVIVNDVNIGYKRTWNNLIRLVSGDLIAFQDSDDWSEPTRIEKQVNAFLQDPDLALCGTWAHIVDRKGRNLRINKRPVQYSDLLAYSKKGNPVLGASMMVKREVLLETGGYRDFFIENNLSFQDFDVVLRIIERYKGINLPEPLYYYRQHPASNSKQISVIRNISEQIVLFLAEQRRLYGADGLQDPQYFNEMVAYIEELKKPYQEDPSRIYRDYAAHFMYARLHGAAIGASARAVASGPARLVNYRTLLYCIRKSLF